MQKWESEKHNTWVFQHEAFELKAPQMVHHWESQVNGVRVQGQLNHDEELGRCMGCTERWKLCLEVQCTSKRAELTTKVSLMGHGEEK